MLVDVEIMVEAENQEQEDEKLEDLDIELEGVESNGKAQEFRSIPVNTTQITMIQEMEDGHCLVFFSESFPPVTAKRSKDKLKEYINNQIKDFYGEI